MRQHADAVLDTIRRAATQDQRFDSTFAVSARHGQPTVASAKSTICSPLAWLREKPALRIADYRSARVSSGARSIALAR
jgi:hypothetical protein